MTNSANAIATDSKVVKAANELFEENGEFPSIRAVREVVGGGSNTTIGGYLKQWKKEKIEGERKEGSDRRISAGLAVYVDEVYDKLKKEAAYEFDIDRENLESINDSLQTSLDELHNKFNEEEKRAELAEIKAEELKQANMRLNDQVSNLEKDIVDFKNEVRLLSQNTESLKEQLKTAKESKSEARQAQREGEERYEILLKEEYEKISRSNTRIEELVSENSKLQAEFSGIEDDLAEAEKRLTLAEKKMNDSGAEVVALRSELASSKDRHHVEINRLKDEINILKIGVEKSNSESEKLDEVNKALRDISGQQKERINELEILLVEYSKRPKTRVKGSPQEKA